MPFCYIDCIKSSTQVESLFEKKFNHFIFAFGAYIQIQSYEKHREMTITQVDTWKCLHSNNQVTNFGFKNSFVLKHNYKILIL